MRKPPEEPIIPLNRILCRTALIGILGSAVLSGASGCTGPEPSYRITAPPLNVSGAASAPGTPSMKSALAQYTMPVYWIGRDDGRQALYREYIPLDPGSDPITSALSYMMAAEPFDKTYKTPWSKPSKLAASISAQGAITVDVSADAFGRGADHDTARLALQQLVYTATAAAVNASLLEPSENTPVTLLVDGYTDYQAFDRIALTGPLNRDQGALGSLWLIDPQQSSVYRNAPVVLNGRVALNIPAPSWVIRKRQGQQQITVAEGKAELVENSAYSTFSVPLVLDPGMYEVEASWAVPNTPQDKRGTQRKSFTVL